MTDGLKDLDFYAANPDQLPTDPEQLQALWAQLEGGTSQTTSDNQSEERAADGAGEAEPGAASEEGQGEDGSQEQHEGLIASKDGKHTIPYSVLANEREKRRAAEQALRELHERQAAAEAGTSTGGDGGDITDDEFDAIAKDFPAVAKLLERTRRVEAQLADVGQRFKEDEEARQSAERDAVQAAVEANPVLLHWQQSDPDRWIAAVEADQRLQSSPAHQRMSLEARLQKAVELVDLFYGTDETAPSHTRAQPAVQKPAAPAAVQKAVAAKPRTLSDIPGGAVPSTDPLEEFASISPTELGAKMANMSPDQISALLNRLG